MGAARTEKRTAFGERLGGFVYGTIVVLSVVVAGARGYPDAPGRIAVVVAATSAVFYAAHVYAHALGHSVSHREHLSFADLRAIAYRERSIVEAALLPMGALLLGALDVVSTTAALWAALGAGLAVLAIQGVVFARVERLGSLATLAVVAANLALGLVLVALKLLVTHT